MCCTSSIGNGKASPSAPSSCTRAAGPPVEAAIPSILYRAGTLTRMPAGPPLQRGSRSPCRRTSLTWLMMTNWVHKRSAIVS